MIEILTAKTYSKSQLRPFLRHHQYVAGLKLFVWQSSWPKSFYLFKRLWNYCDANINWPIPRSNWQTWLKCVLPPKLNSQHGPFLGHYHYVAWLKLIVRQSSQPMSCHLVRTALKLLWLKHKLPKSNRQNKGDQIIDCLSKLKFTTWAFPETPSLCGLIKTICATIKPTQELSSGRTALELLWPKGMKRCKQPTEKSVSCRPFCMLGI